MLKTPRSWYDRAMEPTVTQDQPEPHGKPMTLPVITEYIGVRPGYCGGEPHILGHRIKVRHVAVWHEQMGMTPTEIAATYPTITLAQVHAALAYYYDHRDEIRAAIEDEHRFVEELRAKTPSLLQEKLKRLMYPMNSQPCEHGCGARSLSRPKNRMAVFSVFRRRKWAAPSALPGARGLAGPYNARTRAHPARIRGLRIAGNGVNAPIPGRGWDVPRSCVLMCGCAFTKRG